MESNRKGSTEERKERASNMVKTGELEVMRAWFLRVFVICGFLCFFENVSCFEERV